MAELTVIMMGFRYFFGANYKLDNHDPPKPTYTQNSLVKTQIIAVRKQGSLRIGKSRRGRKQRQVTKRCLSFIPSQAVTDIDL